MILCSFVTQIRAGSIGYVHVPIARYGYIDSLTIQSNEDEFETPTARIFKDSACKDNQFSSQVCVNGTKGCKAAHDGPFIVQVKLQNLASKSARCKVDLCIVEA